MKTTKRIFIPVSTIILILSVSACLKDDDLHLAYSGYTPAWMDDGWEISTPQAENLNPVLIDQLYENIHNEVHYPTIRSLLIVKNNKLVGEAYCKTEEDRVNIHNLMSATKSVVSMLIGIAVDKSLIDSINTPVYKYLAPYFDSDPGKRPITIRQTLMMETGLGFDNDVHTRQLLSGNGNSLTNVLSKDLRFSPGTSWQYNDGNPQLLSGIIQAVSGRPMAELANEYLFAPLGINRFQWESHPDGLNFGALGLWLTPRDMAKIGLLMANQGMWEGASIISEKWVSESTKRQSQHQDYGYYWYPIEDKAFYAEGHGGQLIWVFPDKQLVVVITSDPYTKGWKLFEGYSAIFENIVLALKD